MSSDLINSNMSQDMRKLLNIMEDPMARGPEVGDPDFVMAHELVEKRIKDGFNKFFNKSNTDPLTIMKGEPFQVKWNNNVHGVFPIRFRVPVSDNNKVGLLMDIIPIRPGISNTGQQVFDFPEPDTDSNVVEPDSNLMGRLKGYYQKFRGGESVQSDYSFLRTPLWETNQQITELDQMIPAFKPLANNPGSGNALDIWSTRQIGQIIITKNMPGKSNNDLYRKAYLIEFISKLTGPNSLLINTTGNDQSYLRAVAKKHNLNYQDV